MVALIVRGRFACGRDLWVGRVVRASRSQPISRSTRMRGNVGEQGNKTRGAAVEQSKENAQARRRGQRKREREGYCLGVCVGGDSRRSDTAAARTRRVGGVESARIGREAGEGVRAHGCGALLVCGWSLRIRGRWWMGIGRVRAARRGPTSR